MFKIVLILPLSNLQIFKLNHQKVVLKFDEKINLCLNPKNSPKLYLRYVDDVFAVFENNNASLSFLNVLSNQHKNMKFTVEHFYDLICFLDVKNRNKLQ